VVGKYRNAQILVYVPVTCVPEGTNIEVKTLGLLHLYPPDSGERSGPRHGACILHHWADELLI